MTNVKKKGNDEPKKKPTKPEFKPDENMRGIIRICGRDVKGHLTMDHALKRIKGIGNNMSENLARILIKKLKIKPDVMVGTLSEEQIDEAEKIIMNPNKHEGIPDFLHNRRKDHETGKDVHMIGNDLAFSKRNDIQRAKLTRTWVGSRHMTKKGKVRGQSTRSTGRKSSAVGVIRRKTQAKVNKAVQNKK